MNMFKSVKAKSVDEYIESIPDERRTSIEFLHKFIQEQAPSLKPNFIYNMLGYGSFKYLNYKKETVDWPTIALANQKNYISLYICAIYKGEYVAERFKDKLGKVNVGKSCIRFKSLDDLDLKELSKVIKIAEKSPGLDRSSNNN